MNKFNFSLILGVILSIGFMSSCDTVDPGTQNPLLTLTTIGLSATNTVNEDSTFTVNISVGENPESKSNIEDLVVTTPGPDTTIAVNAPTGNYSFVYNAPADGQTATYTFSATDKAGKTAAQTLTVTGEADSIIVQPTPLGAATAFSMERCGSNNNPEMFGLEFSSVTGAGPFNAVVMTSTADKMVVLTSGEWTSITSVEDLTAAVDGGTSVASITMPATGAVNQVVGVKTGTSYTLVHFTNVTAPSPCAAGSMVTITGDSKE